MKRKTASCKIIFFIILFTICTVFFRFVMGMDANNRSLLFLILLIAFAINYKKIKEFFVNSAAGSVNYSELILFFLPLFLFSLSWLAFEFLVQMKHGI